MKNNRSNNYSSSSAINSAITCTPELKKNKRVCHFPIANVSEMMNVCDQINTDEEFYKNAVSISLKNVSKIEN